MAEVSRFKPTETMAEFMASEKYVRVLAGPVGSGKSVCSVHELLALAMRQEPNSEGERKSRTLIVRNTTDQLRSTTMKTFFDWVPPGVYGTWKATEKVFYMDLRLPDRTRVKAEFMFMPLESPDDVRKALSLELTFLWVNEWRELHPDVIDGLLMRLRRFPSGREGGPTRSCAIFDTNMPDVDTWHYDKMEDPPNNWSIHVQPAAVLDRDEYIARYHEAPDGDYAAEDGVGRVLYPNPKADNAENLDPMYYPDIIPGKSQDFVDVYLRSRYGRSLHGLPVYDRTFSQDLHIADEPYAVLKAPDYPVVIGLDFGRTPAAVLLQRNVYGQVVVLDEVTSENMGIETFLKTKLTPLLTTQYIGCTFVVAPDPAGWQKQQIGEVSPVDVVKRAGYRVVKPVTNDPDRRIQSVERALMQQVAGRPMLVVNPGCEVLLKGFKHGYRYKVRKDGTQEQKPEKNEFSHDQDALQYGVLVIENNQDAGAAAQSRRREVKPAPFAWA